MNLISFYIELLRAILDSNTIKIFTKKVQLRTRLHIPSWCSTVQAPVFDSECNEWDLLSASTTTALTEWCNLLTLTSRSWGLSKRREFSGGTFRGHKWPRLSRHKKETSITSYTTSLSATGLKKLFQVSPIQA